MSGWTAQPRKASAGCYGCHQERGAVMQALSARISRVGTLWLCAGCAASGVQRQAFIDEYARKSGLAIDEAEMAGPRRGHRSPGQIAGAEALVPRRRRDEL